MRDINKLIIMCRQGSQEAFEEIFNIYKNLMYSIISKYNKNVINSKEDLMQIASISLLKALKTFDINKNYKFSTYLQTIIGNDLNTVYRVVQKRNAIVNSLDDVLFNEDKLTVKDTVADDTNIEEEVMENVVSDFIQECLSRYKYAYPRKYDTVKYSMMNMPNREIEKYVSCKRSQISKNFTHFQNYCKDLAIKEGIIC